MTNLHHDLLKRVASLQTGMGKRGVEAGVRVGWLKQFAARCSGLSTRDVVHTIIVTDTRESLSRYVDIMRPGDVGRAKYFFSHVWGAPFTDLVSAAAYTCADDDFVWMDIFANLQHKENITVLQRAEKQAELDFASIVRSCAALILVAQHIPAVAGMNRNDAINKRVPAEARKSCAFFRVWCICELLAARDAGIPVIMLAGNGGPDLRYRTNDSMLDNLLWMIDIEQAAATVEADRTRILNDVHRHPGIAAANQSFKGAVCGAMRGCMNQWAVIRAALGDPRPLSQLNLRSQAELAGAMHGAAAAGLMGPLQMLLGRGADVDIRGQYQLTPLISASQAGQLKVVQLLLAHKADPNAQTEHGVTAVREAAAHDYPNIVQLLTMATQAR